MLGSTTNIAVVLNALWKGVGASPKAENMPQLDQKGEAELEGYEEQFRKEMKSLVDTLDAPGVAAQTDEVSDLDPGAEKDLQTTELCAQAIAFCKPLFAGGDHKWIELFQCLADLIGRCGPAATAYVADMAVCADNGLVPVAYGSRACPFPRARLIDGGYVDNLAAAQTVGVLQRAHPASTPLRAVLVMNQDNTGGTPEYSDLRNLFSENGGQSLAIAGMTSPVSTVFATKWADVSLAALADTSYVHYAELSMTTVDNKIFGVVAGSKIEVLVISLDGPIGLTIGVTTSVADYELLGAYSKDGASPAVETLVGAWLAKTSGSA
mmetsp:Transcript_17298/g.44310  ORF Transcript_17298/g.44310 Transcript_17298/m.44310 type:complete len:323 (-) Transcript_17298:369-1337(-)